MMPKMDGLEVCRRLKGDARTSPIPVLLVTALHERHDRLAGMACGANDFITKPVDTDEVLLRVRNALRLKRLRDELDTLLKMRETLSDMIVHDIRNPLLAIRLTAMRIASAQTPEPAKSLAQAILGQTQQIDRFICDLLDISRMEHASFRPNIKPEDLSQIALTAAESARTLADDRRLRILVQKPHSLCEAQVDEKLIVRLLENLLDNAIKYAPAGSDVWIRICPKDETHPTIRLLVEDEGPGVPLDYRETIFDKYACIQNIDPSIHQTGLGLAFCRMVAEAHGGRVYVTDRPPHGSVFVVELP
jgi:K+-sensing histidine kinase KdpD